MIITDRLNLRKWFVEDIDPFTCINKDPKVMEFFPKMLSQQETKNLISRINSHMVREGFGLWAVELRTNGEFIGFIGLLIPDFETHFTPCVEIAWRLSSNHWDNGYATEGAKAVLNYGFETLGLEEIVSFTVPENIKSINVMKKIGMQRDLSNDFAHPKISLDQKLSKHVLYRISKENTKI